MADAFGPRGVHFAFIYTREAHPAEHCRAHTSFDDKLAAARRMVQRWGIRRQMLVDDLEGTVHRAYGSLPNMSWIIDRSGRVAYKANWTDHRTIRVALEQELVQAEDEAAGRRLMPYMVEWRPKRHSERPPFLEGLVEAGPSAVEEFIAAAEQSWGAGAARPMRTWWEARREE